MSIWRRGCEAIIRCVRSAPVNEALGALEREFAALYARARRPSIPPEKLLRAMLLQAFKTVAGQGKTRFRGVERVGLAFTFAARRTIWCACPGF